MYTDDAMQWLADTDLLEMIVDKLSSPLSMFDECCWSWILRSFLHKETSVYMLGTISLESSVCIQMDYSDVLNSPINYFLASSRQ